MASSSSSIEGPIQNLENKHDKIILYILDIDKEIKNRNNNNKNKIQLVINDIKHFKSKLIDKKKINKKNKNKKKILLRLESLKDDELIQKLYTLISYLTNTEKELDDLKGKNKIQSKESSQKVNKKTVNSSKNETNSNKLAIKSTVKIMKDVLDKKSISYKSDISKNDLIELIRKNGLVRRCNEIYSSKQSLSKKSPSKSNKKASSSDDEDDSNKLEIKATVKIIKDVLDKNSITYKSNLSKPELIKLVRENWLTRKVIEEAKKAKK